MSQESIVYGCILGIHGGVEDWYDFYPLNQAAIDALPREDDYPPLTRDLFTVPMNYTQHGVAFYRRQVIHFGASFSNFSENWHEWLPKFEALLPRLYWDEARLHLEIELYGEYEYRWRAAWPTEDPSWRHSPRTPTTEWTFTGGPRDFRIGDE
jgi:hypothetical protein